MPDTIDVQKQRNAVLKSGYLEYATRAAIRCLGHEDPRYEQETFPILVSNKDGSKKTPIVCSTIEDFLKFKADLMEILTIPAFTSVKLIVFWDSIKQGEPVSHVVDGRNLYATLRMMQARPGKDILQVAVVS